MLVLFGRALHCVQHERESLFFLDCDSEDWLKADEADRQMWSSMYSAMGLDPEWKFLWIHLLLWNP